MFGGLQPEGADFTIIRVKNDEEQIIAIVVVEVQLDQILDV